MIGTKSVTNNKALINLLFIKKRESKTAININTIDPRFTRDTNS